MWALRRVSSHSLKAQGLNVAAFRTFSGIGSFSNHGEEKSSNVEQPDFGLNRLVVAKTCHNNVRVPSRSLAGSRCFSTEAGAKSGREEESKLEESFSELDTPVASEATSSSSDSSSESELSGGEDETLEGDLETVLVEDLDSDASKEVLKKKWVTSALGQLIMEERSLSITNILNDYFADGKELKRSEIYDALLDLRKRKLYGKALQLSEWVEANKRLEFVERDYATRVDLIGKVRGLQKAENYVGSIPESHRTELVYRTLLANCVSSTHLSKAEGVFNKMKDLGFPTSSFACNQLLILYKRADKRKIADVLMMMEKENVKATLFTYLILIDTKGQSNDLVGMDQVVETMKAEGIEPNTRVLATLAKHYAAGGLKDKAEAVLKEMEGSDLNANRWLFPVLLPVYAELGRSDEVERIWKICESKPRDPDFLAAITAWGKLKDVAKAEDVFDQLSKVKKKLLTKHYTAMLRVYVDNKMLAKGKDLLKKMGDSGCYIGPVAWDAIVRLYIGAGELEKADSVLQKAAEQSPQKPLFNSYIQLLDQYAKRGDVHNAEKMFHRMRLAGYVARAKPFHSLLQAYINAKAPAYGFRERMKADNIFPNRALAGQLAQVDAFRKTAVSELLD